MASATDKPGDSAREAPRISESRYAEFVGQKLWDVGPFADRADSKEMFAQLQASGYVRYDDLPLKSKSGAEIPVEFVSNSYDREGIKVIQCNIRNITEQKRAESERAQLASIAESSSAGNPPEIPGGTDREVVEGRSSSEIAGMIHLSPKQPAFAGQVRARARPDATRLAVPASSGLATFAPSANGVTLSCLSLQTVPLPHYYSR